tara:strand:+ start:822 stop:1037 length:216 start_codon:yes stop_codon:yes gene_type:complete
MSVETKYLVNDTLNLLRGKLIRYLLEDTDMRVIANLVQVADQNNLVYDPEHQVYVQAAPAPKKRGRPRKED